MRHRKALGSWRGTRPRSVPGPRDPRSQGTTGARAREGEGGSPLGRPGCAPCGCGPPVPPRAQVPVVIGDEPGQDRVSLRGLETARSAPQCSRRWRRRRWIALGLRTLQPLGATESGQGHSADASYGPLVWRLLGSFVWFSSARVSGKGERTREERLCSLQHAWRFVDSEALGGAALS